MLPRSNITSQTSRHVSTPSLRRTLSTRPGYSGLSLLHSRGTFSRHDSISAKAYRTVTPAANLVLQKKWDDMKYDEHRQKVETMKPVVDSRSPTVYRHFYANSCRMRDEEAKKAQQMKDNVIVLQRIANVLASKSQLDNHNDNISRSLNIGQRQRDLLRIAHENLALFQRIQMKEPHYNHMKWIDSWRTKEGYRAICSRHVSALDVRESTALSLTPKRRTIYIAPSSRIQLKVVPVP